MNRIAMPLVVLAALAACGDGGSRADETAATAAPDSTAAAATAPPADPAQSTGATVTDPQIAAIVVAANQVDVQVGELARSRASDPRVKEFAERMITDHSGVNKAAGDLVAKLGVTPEESPTSQQLTQGGEQSRASLQGKSGAEFDRAYIDHEVTYHQAVLDAIDRTLIPSAQNAELKALLQQTRPAVEAHLQHAREIQSSLARGQG